jgi:hypothetical protein
LFVSCIQIELIEVGAVGTTTTVECFVVISHPTVDFEAVAVEHNHTAMAADITTAGVGLL